MSTESILKFIVQCAAYSIAFIYVSLEYIAHRAYISGYKFGTFIHTLNDRIAYRFVILTSGNLMKLFTPKPAPAPAFIHPMMEIAQEMNDNLTVKALRMMYGIKGKMRKQNLIEAILIA
jgi:hypothetical protein